MQHTTQLGRSAAGTLSTPMRPPVLIEALRALRPRQWSKNLLVFLPLLAAHHAGDVERLRRAGLAFASFCLCASSAYVLNDVLDVARDRAHATKRTRPFAATGGATSCTRPGPGASS